ncbi:MAG: hypothetical protein Q9170_006369 [Blastenia crenularia]
MCKDIHQHGGEDFEVLRDLDGDLCVFKNRTKEYILETKPEPTKDLEGEDSNWPAIGQLFSIISYPEVDPDYVGREPVSEDNYHNVQGYPNRTGQDVSTGAQSFQMLQLAKDGAAVKCVFAWLGWLAERKIQSPTKPAKARTVTYFQLLLNLSTDPVSVWIMYDYHIFSWPDQWTNPLGPYTNELYRNPSTGPKSKSKDQFTGYQSTSMAEYNELRKHYTNIELLRPVRDKKVPSIAMKTPTPPASPANKKDKVGNDKTGYFGLRRPFDLALLAPDVKYWSINGFKPEEVKTCLYGSNVRLGASMQKEPLYPNELDEALRDRVEIKDLCFESVAAAINFNWKINNDKLDR